MVLNNESVKNQEWKEKGYFVPSYDREKMIEETVANPEWVHFGAGNIFRAFQANLAQRMLEQGLNDKGVTVVEGFDYGLDDSPSDLAFKSLPRRWNARRTGNASLEDVDS